jgi:hypothetical protein
LFIKPEKRRKKLEVKKRKIRTQISSLIENQ